MTINHCIIALAVKGRAKKRLLPCVAVREGY